MDSDPTQISEPKLPVLMSSQTLILASLFVAIISIAIFIFVSRRKSRAKRNLVVLIGPSNSGKTAIFSSLVYGHAVPTITSMQANSSFLDLPGKRDPIQIVDVPGHPRLRDQFKDFLSSAKALAFVVDANTASRNTAVVAEHLHTVLDAIMAIPPSQPLPTLLILAHKCDLIKTSSLSADTSALAVTRVQTILERELERRKLSQSGGMGVEALGDENNNEKLNMGGLDCRGPGGTFKFENWEGGEVVFLGTSVQSSRSDEKSVKGSIAPLMDWIEENM
ncbi:MAG: signal recognition particle receptor beta subunit-domain-containing protein [Lentinula lateritia]|nr:MAG: signal recognition particle receptor beta subunit-domain-containing protein [Lentinula lateritia]